MKDMMKKMSEKIEELDATIDELKRYVATISLDLDAMYGELESLNMDTGAIAEIQDILEKAGHWLIKKV